MYRFKVSKYKNAAPKVPKKEQCITEIPCGRVMSSFGNFVQVSGKHIAFNVDSGAGGCTGILPINSVGRRNRKVPTIYAHSDFLSDMNFSPFDDDLLATCSYDGTLKLWRIPDEFEDTIDAPLVKMRLDEEVTRRLDIVRFHPTANEVLAASSHDVVHFIDLNAGETKCSVECDEDVQFMSLDWKLDGKLMISSCKDTSNRVLDPRENAVSLTFPGFAGFKDSRIMWMGDLDYIIGAGFTKQRDRVVTLWDIRNPSICVSQDDIDQGSGSLMLFHDIDTNLVMLGGKGDPFIKLLEFNEATKALSFSSHQSLAQQSFGMGMAPKRVLDVMNGEVNRMFQLSKNMIMPLPYIIPRKSYREFQPDLFPDTVYSGTASLSSSEWFNGENKEVIKLSLDPKYQASKRDVAGLKDKLKKEDASGVDKPSIPMEQAETLNDYLVNKSNEALPIVDVASKHKETKAEAAREDDVKKTDSLLEEPSKTTKKVLASFSDNSKFKYILGEAMHRSNNIENVKNVSESLPAESDGIQAYKDFVALPLSGAGGQISIIHLSKPGRLPDSGIPVLENSSTVLDFAMDPFKTGRIVTGCEDWKIRVWSELTEAGLTETDNEPSIILEGHQNRVTIVKFHPYANDILVSASQDLTMRVWDLSDVDGESHIYEGHTEQILCLDWHPDGEKIVTFCRDKKIRIYEPLQDLDPIMEGDGPDVRGARICWCGPDNSWLIVSTTFGSGRALHLYNSQNFQLLSSIDELEESSSVLSLHYDESSSVLFAAGKGERMIYCFEINEKPPHLHVLSHAKFTDLHQSVKFLQKNVVDVQRVEIARAVRLTKSYMEFVSFTIPRIKTDYFQDDIFPKVRVTWEALVDADFWADGNVYENGSKPVQDWISLKPDNMENLSDAPQELPKASKYCSQDILSEKTDEEKKAELIDAMMNKLDIDDRLEQDDFEGVDEEEWDD